MARPTADNRRVVERQRAKERQLQQLHRHLSEVTTGTLYAHSERRVEALRRKQQLKQEQKELEMDEVFTVQKQGQQYRSSLEKIEKAVAVELQREEAKKIRQETERKRICDASEELRDLKDKLRLAKVNKERAAQIIEQQIRSAEEYEAEVAMAVEIEACRLQQMEQEKRQQLEHMEYEKKAKLMQKQQIAERYEARIKQEEGEYSRDKEQVEKLLAHLAAEEQRERQRQRGKREQEKKQMEEMRRLKDQWCQQQRELDAQEDERIRAYAALQAARQEQQDEEREKREAEKRQVLMELSKQQIERDNKQKEYLELLSDLHREEKEEKDRKKEEEERLKRIREREELLRAFDEQMAEKERLRQLAVAREKQYRRELLEQFAEEERLEQLNDQKRRLKLQEHLRQAALHAQQRRRLFDEEREAERQERKRLLAMEQAKEAVVQDERRRLLEEYADLVAFLPKGTLKVPEEQKLIEEAAASKRDSSEPHGKKRLLTGTTA